MTNLQKRKNLSAKFQSKEEIKTLLQPQKRSFFEIIKRAYEPVFENKRLVACHLIHAIAGGLLPLISAFVIFGLSVF
ncbi:MAG: hypothetical protein GX326_05115 [Clostridiaceae bacterium]|nr:hypothetical protein [Clostridiaceae bacterium]